MGPLEILDQPVAEGHAGKPRVERQMNDHPTSRLLLVGMTTPRRRGVTR